MRSRRSNASVIVALGASVLVHLLVIVPLLLAMMAARTTPQRIEPTFSSAELLHPEPPEREEPEPQLGIEESKASTFTWVGYEDYLEHLAQLSEVEQAAFTEDPAGMDAPVIEASTPPVEVAEHQETIETEPTEPVEALDPARALEVLTQLPEIDLTPIARILETVGLLGRDSDEPGEQVEHIEAPIEQEFPEQVALTQPTEPATEPQPEPQPQPTPGEPGDAADKQSEPTSVVDVPPANWRLGRPIAAHGVELKPQRPHFYLIQRLTASPCNPIVEIQFNRHGVAVKGIVLLSSGDASVDSAIEASVYRWRATGEVLNELRGEQTFDVRIRFILTSHSRCP